MDRRLGREFQADGTHLPASFQQNMDVTSNSQGSANFHALQNDMMYQQAGPRLISKMQGAEFQGASESNTQVESSSAIRKVGIPSHQYLPLCGSQLGNHWAENLLVECAKAISEKEVARVQHLLWALNELGSPYGDYEQRLASCFLQALFCKVTGTGPRRHEILSAAVDRSQSFDSMRKMILKFQEASPWTTFGHVAANGAILEALEGELRVHIVDISNTFCTQWPTLLEALATRPEGAPHLRLTTVIVNKEGSAMKVMKEVGARLEKFARLMGVPFEFNILQQSELEKMQEDALGLRLDEALVVNFIQSLHHVPGSAGFDQLSRRDMTLCMFRSLNPKIVTLVEDEVDLMSDNFMHCFYEAYRFYSLFVESLEESFPRTSNERLMLERETARSMINILACSEQDQDNHEGREKGCQWSERLQRAGFAHKAFSDDVLDDVKALLKRYKEGWGLNLSNADHNGISLTWKEQSVINASAWRPA